MKLRMKRMGSMRTEDKNGGVGERGINEEVTEGEYGGKGKRF